MVALYKIALVVHIFSGTTALLAGIFAIISPKGKKIHRMAGITFFFGMLLVCTSAIFISILKNNLFLLHIAVLSFYMVYSGYRSVKNKSLKPGISDWFVLVVSTINTILMICSLNIILIVFGSIGGFLMVSDLRIFILTTRQKAAPKNKWLLRHLGMMLGAYISTSTAFIVVNITVIDYPWIPWLVPTLIGTPLIAYWTKKYSVKTN